MSSTANILLRDQPVTIPTEEELIRAAQENPQAFSKLYERHYAAIFGFIFKRVNEKDITADITQQVFVKALTNINKYVNKGFPYTAYLYRIATNECNSYFRTKNSVRFIAIEKEWSEELIDELAIEDDYEAKMGKLKAVFQLLKLDEIQLLELRFFELKSFKEVGYIMNITENLAKVKTYRLLNRMRKIMEK